ncbi:hypothetical protein AbraIFM66951_001581 [Aspergillus brasiliensis]|nr:hypothetical protein AbraIFM66951_001581 [Aspergillus brasiliensis]
MPDNNTTFARPVKGRHPFSSFRSLFTSAGKKDKPFTTSTRKEPESPSEKDTASFIWEDINPPAEYYLAEKTTITPPSPPPTYTYSQQQPQDKEQDPTMIDTTTKSIPVSSLPGYNDVSGAVIVDYDGFPHFLSPQEEEERKMKLQRAVQEKMLGLPRQTSFEWERPLSAGSSAAGWLPRYSPSTKRGAQR